MHALVDSSYRFIARQLDDIEKARKAANNQINVFTRATDVADADGRCRGMGYPEDHDAVRLLRDHIDRLEQSEKECKRTLEKTFTKTNPLAKVVADNHGVGTATTARLLGVIGDPYLKPAQYDIETGELVESERVRTLSELFSYCGMTPSGVKRKGQKLKYNPAAKTALWVMTDNIYSKQNAEKSKLKALMETYRDYYLTKVDDKGKPWNRMHAIKAAQRKAGRELLKMLYFEAERVHNGWEESSYQTDLT